MIFNHNLLTGNIEITSMRDNSYREGMINLIGKMNIIGTPILLEFEISKVYVEQEKLKVGEIIFIRAYYRENELGNPVFKISKIFKGREPDEQALKNKGELIFNIGNNKTLLRSEASNNLSFSFKVIGYKDIKTNKCKEKEIKNVEIIFESINQSDDINKLRLICKKSIFDIYMRPYINHECIILNTECFLTKDNSFSTRKPSERLTAIVSRAYPF